MNGNCIQRTCTYSLSSVSIRYRNVKCITFYIIIKKNAAVLMHNVWTRTHVTVIVTHGSRRSLIRADKVKKEEVTEIEKFVSSSQNSKVEECWLDLYRLTLDTCECISFLLTLPRSSLRGNPPTPLAVETVKIKCRFWQRISRAPWLARVVARIYQSKKSVKLV